jgi:hypothetical protein
MLCNSAFGPVTIGRGVRPMIHGLTLPPLPLGFRLFSAERLAVSQWTQKTKDRAFQELSNGMYLNKIRPELSSFIVL